MKKFIFKVISIFSLCFFAFSTSNVKSANPEAQEILFYGIENNDLNRVKEALYEGADINAINPKTGNTAIGDILLKINEFDKNKNLWMLPAAIAVPSSVILAYSIFSSAMLQLAQLIARDNAGLVKHLKDKALVGAALSSIGTVVFGRITYVLKMRLQKSKDIALFLMKSPNIKIDAHSRKFIKNLNLEIK